MEEEDYNADQEQGLTFWSLLKYAFFFVVVCLFSLVSLLWVTSGGDKVSLPPEKDLPPIVAEDSASSAVEAPLVETSPAAASPGITPPPVAVETRLVRFMVARDHSASQTKIDQRLSAVLVDSILAGVYDPNKINAYQFGTSVNPIGAATNAAERKILRSDWKAFVPSSGWATPPGTGKIDDRRPLDDQFTNISGLFENILPAIRDFASAGEYVCAIVLTDGDNDPPRRRGYPEEFLGDEHGKQREIASEIAAIKRDAPDNVEIHVIEIGNISEHGAVVGGLLGGFGETHQAASWQDVAPLIREIQNRCQLVYWWENLPPRIDIRLGGKSAAEPLGRFTFRSSGAGYFCFEAVGLDPLLLVDITGTVSVDDQAKAFSEPVWLYDQAVVELKVFINPAGANQLPTNYFWSLRVPLVIKAVAQGNKIPLLPKDGAGLINAAAVYPNVFVRRYILTSILGAVLLFIWRGRRVRRQYRLLRETEGNDQTEESFGRGAAMKGFVLYQGDTHILFGQEQKIGLLTFTVADGDLHIFPGNDMDLLDEFGDIFSELQAGQAIIFGKKICKIRDQITGEIYELENISLINSTAVEEVEA